jgi:1-acyl-sn-glycerol-3-phosphate acyltransferase
MLLYCARLLRLAAGLIDLTLFTIAMYGLTWLPASWLRGWYPRLFQSWCRVFVRALDVDLRLHQKHKKALPQQYLLISNHPSAFEDIGVPALFDVVSLAKADVKNWFIVGRINAAAGTLYVDRESQESRRAALNNMVAALEQGINVAVYPEGGCKGRRLFTSFRYGAFEASMRTGVPILPLFIHYEAQQDFEWQPPYTLLDKIRHFLTTRNNRANFYVFDPIYPQGFKDGAEFNQHVYGLYLGWQAKYLE